MPKLVYPEGTRTQITDNIRIGYREKGASKTWYARFYWEQGQTHAYYSLRMPYEDSQISQRLAEEAARKKYNGFHSRVSRGEHYTSDMSLRNMSYRYLKEIRKKAQENDVLAKTGLPKWKDHKDGFWTVKKYNKRETYHNQIAPFFKGKWNHNIADIPLRFLNTFVEWALKEHDWAPSTINYHITEIRRIWVWAFEKGYVDHIPTIKRAPQDLRKRRRRHLKEEEWDLMIEWAAERYRARYQSPSSDPESIDLAYQYYMWLHIIGYTGVRPPHGQVLKNLLHWDSYKVEWRGTEDETRVFHRFDEKNKEYFAAIMPECWDIFDLMEEFRDLKGLDSTYMFQHTEDKDGCWERGDPIKNFKTSWKTMLRDLGLDMPKGTPQAQTLQPYSLRAYYITMRLRYGDMRIEDLAEATGTSVEMIKEIYYEFTTQKQYKSLTSGSVPERTITRERKEGYAILK